VLAHLPTPQQQQVTGIPALSSGETSDFFAGADVRKWHPSHLVELLQSLPSTEQRAYLSLLPLQVQSEVASRGGWIPLEGELHPAAARFFIARWRKALAKKNPWPLALLQPSVFAPYLEMSHAELVQAMDLMAMHTLIAPLRHIIDKEQRNAIKRALGMAPSGALLLDYIHHLQSDLKENTQPLLEVVFPLQHWDWCDSTFYPLLHRFGVYCMAKAIAAEERAFIEHLALHLDVEHAQWLLSLTKGTVGEKASHALQKVATKALNFVLQKHKAPSP
jgi:hypothetical protein